MIQAISNSDQSATVQDKQRARHCAKFFFIKDGKLWRMANNSTTRPHSRLECIPRTEAIELAWIEHASKGHWGRDLIKLQLMDCVYSPRLDRSITTAILECGKCKNFGPTHLHSLLEPIVRRHPFELMVADYLSMPAGKAVITPSHYSLTPFHSTHGDTN